MLHNGIYYPEENNNWSHVDYCCIPRNIEAIVYLKDTNSFEKDVFNGECWIKYNDKNIKYFQIIVKPKEYHELRNFVDLQESVR